MLVYLGLIGNPSSTLASRLIKSVFIFLGRNTRKPLLELIQSTKNIHRFKSYQFPHCPHIGQSGAGYYIRIPRKAAIMVIQAKQESTTMTAPDPEASKSMTRHLTDKHEEQPKELSFVSRLNCTTGKMEWVELPDDYDFHQEIARSAYADMLHDHDRNMRYFQALKYEIGKLKAENKPANVLDIGTGTGLLSMMAVVAGADAVFACDAFTPMLECARKVVKRNGFEDKIKLIPKRSTELSVGVDLPFRCNILVTEVFDTELIGEGAISTFNHAHEELLTDSPIVIPATSTVYAQVLNSAEVERWNSLPKELNLSRVSVKFSQSISTCPGIPSVQDLQLDAIQPSEFTALSPPIPIFSFDFTTKIPIPSDRSRTLEFVAEDNGAANAVFMWWDLDMDTSGTNVLSCQPSYVKNGPQSWFATCPPQDAAWRDHWMHSVYYIPRSSGLRKGKTARLNAAHDEFAFWFDISENEIEFPKVHPICQCGVHNILSRSQIRMMNDVGRYETFTKCYESLVIPGETTCLCISDCSVLPIILAKLGAKRVIVVEGSGDSSRVSKEFIAENGGETEVIHFVAEDLNKLDDKVLRGNKIDLVTGDPYFQVAMYPWNNLMFWYLFKSVQSSLFSPNVKLAPHKMVVYGMGVKFTHLWKINAPVGVAAEAFDLTDFDKLIEQSSSISDSPVDAQPLWEYESICTSDPVNLLELDLTTDLEKLESSGEIRLTHPGTNGFALWIEWELDSTTKLSTGPRHPTSLGKPIIWERYSKQGVYFIRPSESESNVKYTVSFEPSTADFMFNFSKS